MIEDERKQSQIDVKSFRSMPYDNMSDNISGVYPTKSVMKPSAEERKARFLAKKRELD